MNRYDIFKARRVSKLQVTLERVEIRFAGNCEGCIFYNEDDNMCDLVDASNELVEKIFPCEEYDEDGHLTKSYIWRKSV